MDNFNIDSNYIDFSDMTQDTYYQIPKWLMKPKYNKIPIACKLVYMLISDTCKLSYSNYKTNNYEGRYFDFWDYTKNVPRCKISYDVFMDKLGIGSRNTISKHLDTLEKLNLIERKRNYDSTSFYYVKRYIEELEDIYISNNNFDRDKAIQQIKKVTTGNSDL